MDLKDLQVWKSGIELCGRTYLKTSSFPSSEEFGLTAQMRRAAVSVPSNIAEGKGRGTAKDFANFLHTARASLYELKTHVELAKEVGFLSSSDHEELGKEIDNLALKIGKMINHLRNKSKK
ncbi:MAG TPA: four helix bundle protein [Kosmotogaceae bacterium]|nr:MAG: S23 ribosomal protein [Thermotogales bacterium 46_20]HAA85440.1 four helix bundle protein [Kosmotogaceae bacterium]